MLVKKEILNCVGFVLYKDKDGNPHYCGTAFFIGEYIEDIDKSFVYIVTAKHVVAGIKTVENDGNLYLRVNVKNGDTGLATINLDDWEYHDDPFVDAAVYFGALNSEDVDYNTFPIDHLATDEIINNEEIGIGDEICMTGLFVNHFGKKRNLPILRTGNIAMMPSEPVQAKLGDKNVPMEAYLAECRSIGGLSGSPVFVHLGPWRRKHEVTDPRTDIFYLLGLAQGHWDQSIYKEDEPAISDINNILKEEAVNKGVAIITPIKKVLDIITDEKIWRQRIEAEMEYRN